MLSLFPSSVRFCPFFLLFFALFLSAIGRSFPPDRTNRPIFSSVAMLRSEPNGAVALVPSENSPLSPIFPFVGPEQFVGVQKRRNSNGQMQAFMAKKFERNCFFSPVQCMLSFKDSSNSMGGFSEWPFEQKK